ncbi:UDP-2,3-diacylglucosamine diphosphatase [Orbus sturtevantii]|uniref:UDP-2,3-diacylglucosamine diphosphatase n=1 Tax=Orbus sturtevantii TaxID=3074109 RepID=UPI00370DAF19
MQRFFIADIHLNQDEPGITTGFLHFLQSLPSNSELYILGDLFDYWIGDDIVDQLSQQISQQLNQLKSRNIATYFIHGNRDFLLGQTFAKLCSMTILPEVSVLKNSDENIVILHGDLLCIDDLSYQKFRRKMHSKWLQCLFLLLPRYVRLKIATKLRHKSNLHNQQKYEYIMDVNQQAVESMMNSHHANVMIHGHTHKPAIHQFNVDGKPLMRMVLGAWHDGVNYIHQDQHGELKLIKIDN